MAKGACFGEVLWDIYPTESIIGGAPLNVAFRLNELGTKTTIISAAGEDDLGAGILNFLKKQNIPSEIQIKQNLETGKVLVNLDASGSATYEIKSPAAWDFIELNAKTEALVSEADFLIFGTLAARTSTSKKTLEALIDKSSFPIFDVNLRKPFYDFETIQKWLKQCKLAKFNEDEIAEYCLHFGHTELSLKSQIAFVKQQNGIENICVTRGANGALLLFENQWFEHSGFPAKVVDTVGAGDSFLATLVHGLFSQTPEVEALKTACAMGSLVAEKRGANPKISAAELELRASN